MSAPVITPESDVRTELTGRFLKDSPLAELAHVALGLTVTLLLIGLHPVTALVGWFAALVVASAIRYRVRQHFAAKLDAPADLPWAVIATIVGVGLVWSAGAMPLLLGDDHEMALRVMIVECGLAAAATFTFTATATGFRVFIVSIFVPLVAGIFISDGLTRSSITSALLVVVFGGTMLAIQRRGQAQLTRSLQLHHDLDRNRRVAEAGQAELRESEEQLFQFLESMPVGVVVIDKAGKLYFSNASARNIAGPILEGRPDLAEMTERASAYVPGTQQPYPVERSPTVRALHGETSIDQVEILSPTGMRLVEIHGSPIRDRSGQVAYSVSVVSDLSGRQNADVRRAALNAVLSLAGEATSEEELTTKVLRLLNERFSFSLAELWMNDGQSTLLRRLGSSRRGDDRHIAAFDEGSGYLSFRRGEGLPGAVWKTGEPIWRKRATEDDLTFRRPGGIVEAGLRTAVSAPVFVAGVARGALVLFTTDARDPDVPITETLMAIGAQVGGAIARRRTDAAVRAAEERYRHLVEASTDLVWETDLEGRWTFLNAAAQRIYGMPPADLIGRPFVDRSDPKQVTRDRGMFTKLGRGEVITEYETVHRNASDAPIVLSTSGAPLRDGSGTITGYHGIIRDVGDRAAARAALRAARDAAEQAAAAKSAFLANMSHEIRTPMNGVLGVAELLQGTQLDADQRRMVDLIATSGTALLNVINEILDFSKIEAQQIEIEAVEFDLHDLVDSTVKLAASTGNDSGVQVTTDIRPDVPRYVAGDPTRLRQVLSNLVGNAVKFTHEGEVVTSVQCIATVGKTARVAISVRDTGIGMAPETLSAIFEPFRQADSSMTRRYGGTGLGLSISRRLVELMGGHLVVTSQEGKGSQFGFELFLPVVAKPAADARAEETKAGRPIAPAERSLSVLVAEDNLINQEVARAMLTRRGHSVDIVADGRAAVDAALKKNYDVVLMDIQMPELDGVSATQMIRRQKGAPRPRIIALTANVLPGERERCLANGMDAYLAKPYSARDFFAVLEGDGTESAIRPAPVTSGARPAGKLVDLDELRADLRAAGIEESLPVLVQLFLRDGPGRVEAIAKALASRNAALIGSAAHSLRSAAGAVRATRLMNVLSVMERYAKAGDVAAAAAQLDAVGTEHKAVREWLESGAWQQ